jgi:hypothetical protein
VKARHWVGLTMAAVALSNPNSGSMDHPRLAASTNPDETPVTGRGAQLSPNDSVSAKADDRAVGVRAKAAAGREDGALAADPNLRDDLAAAERYFAACSDLRTGCGDGPDLEIAERAKLRRRALDSLKADLDLRKRQLESGTANVATKVQQILALWKVERDLAGVRQPELVARLPLDEQTEWAAFWAEAAALEQRVQSGGR